MELRDNVFAQCGDEAPLLCQKRAKFIQTFWRSSTSRFNLRPIVKLDGSARRSWEILLGAQRVPSSKVPRKVPLQVSPLSNGISQGISKDIAEYRIYRLYHVVSLRCR